jgi:hypothetical protein
LGKLKKWKKKMKIQNYDVFVIIFSLLFLKENKK